MRAAACIAIEDRAAVTPPANFDDAQLPFARGKLSQRTRRQPLLRLRSRNCPHANRPIVSNHPVRQQLNLSQHFIRQLLRRQINRGDHLSQMKRHRRRTAESHERGGQKMLSGMLLNVVEPALAIDHSSHRSARQQRLGRVVPHFAMFVFLNSDDLRRQFRAAPGGRDQPPSIMRLAAARGIKGRAIERHPPQ